MAQSGYTPILIYASGTASNVPLAANMTSSSSGAELALNYADGKLYFKNSSGVVTLLVGTGGAGVVAGSNTQVQFNNSGVFGASANFTWDGTTVSATKFAGAFNGTLGATTSAAAVVTSLTATADSTFSSTGALTISKGTTGQQPGSPITGMLRYNTTTNQFEGYSGASPAWNPVGGSSIANDTSTASNLYPLFANATSGTALTIYTSNAEYLYKPSTGDLQAPQLLANNGLILNATTLVSSYVIPAGYNANTVGPFTVPSGLTVTVTSGQRWVVL